MSSIIEGYNYDIFISYRQKDNKGDRWVSEFVEALKTELESTFKEEVSVYFDINPHDGLLETHDVDESLKDKLKCLIFIPIISNTYCDPKAFAWLHEFKAFVEHASHDQFGLRVKLAGGNVASRLLPVRINDLDKDDIRLCESVVGGTLRGIDFIYRSPGVNRPLRSKEEKPQDNLNSTVYRDQINKVAQAVKEIISGLKTEPNKRIEDKPQRNKPEQIVKNDQKWEKKTELHKIPMMKFFYGIIILIVVICSALLIPRLFKKDNLKSLESEEILKKAISYYDFFNLWNDYSAKVLITNFRENGLQYNDTIEIKTRENFYRDTYISEGQKIVIGVKNEKCFREVNGKLNPDQDVMKKYGLNCENIFNRKEHHYCSLGMLMEFKAAGLTLNDETLRTKFQGNDCLELKFTCDTNKVNRPYFYGSDYSIYIDPSNYSIKGYKVIGNFSYYVVFSGVINLNGIKMPLSKTYFNSSDNSFQMIDLITPINQK
jgi:hypothetical protein